MEGRKLLFGTLTQKTVTNNYLTIEALEDGLFASLSYNACEYCIDGDDNGRSLPMDTYTETINTGQTLSFRGEITPTSSGIGSFSINKKFNLLGNCMSMLFGDNAANNFSLEGKDSAFFALFSTCKVVEVSDNFLPATILSPYCYYEMFDSCDYLIKTPSLPATTLADSCYSNMFRNCTSLTTAPELPATTLANSCYFGMFSSCVNLTTASELPATTLTYQCYSYMFWNCDNLTEAPELPATTLERCCYESMFDHCISLVNAPELPATTLVGYCYSNMFYGCSNLNYIKMLATDISASECLQYWVYNVASTGTFVKNQNATWDVTGNDGVPSGWAIQYE